MAGFREMENTDQNCDLDAMVTEITTEHHGFEFVDVEIDPTYNESDKSEFHTFVLRPYPCPQNCIRLFAQQ